MARPPTRPRNKRRSRAAALDFSHTLHLNIGQCCTMLGKPVFLALPRIPDITLADLPRLIRARLLHIKRRARQSHH